MAIYEVSKKLHDSEKFGLVSQMQRAAVSAPSNIAEGYRRNSPNDFNRFLSIASGSLAELETQLDICNELYTVEVNNEINEIAELQKMITSLQKEAER